MLTFRHYIAQSSVEGLGLFTDEDIAKDAVLWAFVAGFDIAMEPEKVEALPEPARRHFHHFGWLDKDTGLFHLSVDGDKYTNHSSAPNTYMDGEGRIRAKTDIPRGTEILSDYDVFDRNTEDKFKGKSRL